MYRIALNLETSEKKDSLWVGRGMGNETFYRCWLNIDHVVRVAVDV